MFEALPADPIEIGAPIVAAVAFVATYVQVTALDRGPLSRSWLRVRRDYLPKLDRIKRDLGLGYARYTLRPEEYAGTIPKPVEEVERVLWEHGFRRNPLSAYKDLDDGRTEDGSWAYRDGITDRRQVHVMLFENDEGGTDVYAHDEFSAIHPLVAYEHYRGVDYDPAEGERRTRELLPPGVWDGESTDVDDDPESGASGASDTTAATDEPSGDDAEAAAVPDDG